MEFFINGNLMPDLEVTMQKGDRVYSKAGAFSWMSEGISMETSGRGSFGKMLVRSFAGSSLFFTNFTCDADNGFIVFTPSSPGQILPLELYDNESMIARRGSFLLAESGVLFDTWKADSFAARFLGGAGYFLQKFTGPGRMFVQVGGEARRHDLKAGETLKVSTGHIAMFDPTVTFDVEGVEGLANVVFSGEGLAMATLTGPGSVWLQTMPLSKLARAVRPPRSSSSSSSSSSSRRKSGTGIRVRKPRRRK